MTDLRDMRPAMPARHAARTLLLTLTALALGACGEDTGVTPPPEPIPLIPAVWYMHAANDNDLPDAEISRRFIGVVEELTVVDSARIDIRENGTWEQRYWLRVLHTGALDRTEFVIDEGSWTENGVIMTFTSSLRARTFTMFATTLSQATSDEPMVFFTGAENVIGTYRPTEPTP